MEKLNFKELVQKKKESLIKDYKIVDLTTSDEESLEKLASALVLLEAIESQISEILEELSSDESLSASNRRQLILSLSDLNKSASELRNDISRLMNDLNITRRQRDKDTEEDVLDFLDKLRKAARKFSEHRTVLVFCDECNILVGQVWFKHPVSGSKAHFVCPKCKKIIKYSPNLHSKTYHPKDYNRVPQFL